MAAPIRLPLKSPSRNRDDGLFSNRSRRDLEFLPAALEIVETPPSPLPRAAALSVVGLLFASVTWACLCQVDIVSTATGKIVPTGGGKVIQPLEPGIVKSIRVHDGDHVREGQVLVELEPTDTLADRDRLRNELAGAELEVSRLRSITYGAPFHAPAGADPRQVAIAASEAQEEIAATNAKLSGLDQQIAQHRSELSSSQAEEARLATLLPLATQRTQVFTTLQKKGFGSRLQLIEAQEKEQDTQRSLEEQRQKEPGISATISATQRQRAEASAEEKQKALADLSEASVKARSLAEELRKAEDRLQSRTLTASVDGTVHELSIHTIGGVVQQGQVLLRVAPAGVGIEVEAQLKNLDSGFVRPGMPAEVKVETFPFTRYGTIAARVRTVSADVISQQKSADQSGAEILAEQKQQAEPTYLVRLALQRSSIKVDGREVPLRIGMLVDAEIRTGRRRVINFVLSPIGRVVSESGRER